MDARQFVPSMRASVLVANPPYISDADMARLPRDVSRSVRPPVQHTWGKVKHVSQGMPGNMADHYTVVHFTIVISVSYPHDEPWHVATVVCRYEDERALRGGADGLAVVRTIVRRAPLWLHVGRLYRGQ